MSSKKVPIMRIKKFFSILNLQYISLSEVLSYLYILQYQFFGDLMFCVISITSSLALYFELNISVFSAIIIFCSIEFFKIFIDMIILYIFNKNILKKRISQDE